jgi:hypothetical protein
MSGEHYQKQNTPNGFIGGFGFVLNFGVRWGLKKSRQNCLPTWFPLPGEQNSHPAAPLTRRPQNIPSPLIKRPGLICVKPRSLAV